MLSQQILKCHLFILNHVQKLSYSCKQDGQSRDKHNNSIKPVWKL
jgi:hypothetical protein